MKTLEEYSAYYVNRFENTMRSRKSKTDLNEIRDRLIVLFDKEEDWGALEWSKFLKVSFRTFKNLFTVEKRCTDITIKKFIAGLTELEKKHNIKNK